MSSLPCNPWLSMWRHPKKTVRALIDHQVSYGFLLISLITGLPCALSFVSWIGIGAGLPLLGALFLVVLLAPLLGMVWILVMTTLLFWTGKLFHGNASFLAMRCAMTWASLANLLMMIGSVLLIITFGVVLFQNEGMQLVSFTSTEWAMMISAYILHIISPLYLFVLLVAAVAEAQKFSVGRALGNCFLALLALLGLIQVVSWATF